MKILIADDDALSRRLLEKTLERAGYEVTTVGNGRKAVDQLVRHDAPRLALLDWMMPEIDGTGVCREVRRRRDGVPGAEARRAKRRFCARQLKHRFPTPSGANQWPLRFGGR